MSTHPHRIDPIVREERRRSRNCLRVDYISDGIEPRCNLRPRDERAEWILEHRPNHLREMIECFDYCINTDGCDSCRIAQRVYARLAPPFLSVSIRVVRDGARMSVIALGSCTYYDLYTGSDINACAAWVKERGGALGATHEDAVHGRHRVGFVNWHKIPEGLRPPRLVAPPADKGLTWAEKLQGIDGF